MVHSPGSSRVGAWLAGALWLAPFAQAYVLSPWLQAWMGIPAAAAIWAAAVLAAVRQPVAPAPTMAAALALGLIPLAVAHAAFPDLRTLIAGLGWIVTLGGCALAGRALAMDPARWRAFLRGSAWGAATVVLLAMVVWSGVTDGVGIHLGRWMLASDAGGKPSGPFANGNVFGAVAAVGAIAGTWLAWRGERVMWVPSWVAWVGAAASWSRALWFWLALLLVAAFVQRARIDGRRALHALGVVLTAFLVGVLLGARDWQGHERSAVSHLQAIEQHGLAARLVIWEGAARIGLAAWPVGVGWGRFAAHFLDAEHDAVQAHEDWRAIDSTPLVAHDWPLHLWAEGGIVGLAILLLVLAMLLRVARALRRADDPRQPAAAGAWLLACHGLTNVTLPDPFPLVLLATLLGAGLPAGGWRLPWRACAAALAAAGVALGAAFVSIASAWIDYELWLHASGPAKAARVRGVLADPSTRPFAVARIAAEMAATESGVQRLPQLRGLIEDARRVQEFRAHREALFVADWVEHRPTACARARWLREMRWAFPPNLSRLLDRACAPAGLRTAANPATTP